MQTTQTATTNVINDDSSAAVSILTVEAALLALSARGKGKAGLIIGITLACVVLFSAAVVLIRKNTADSADAHLQQQQQQQEPTGVIQNNLSVFGC